jgi:phosphatidate cytidylyltransferase
VLKRAISGFIFLVLFISALLWNMYSMSILFFVISVFGANELFRLVETDKMKPQIITGGVLAKFVYLFPVAYLMGLVPIKWISLLLLPFLLIPINALYKNEKHTILNMITSYFPALYISFPLVLLVDIIFMKGFFNPYPVLGVFILIWSFDTGAYLSGKYFGKHKLFERISPKKTWEGLIGGGIISFLIAIFVVAKYIPDFKSWEWGLVSLIVVIFGSYGDLIESMVKRNANVKDSGGIMPGHGGILDRFDSVLFATPFFWFFLQWI